jgi:uncharacterized SAM-binding protein YcdF (DUF218 family)
MGKANLQQIADNLNILGDFLAKRDIDFLTKKALIERYGIEKADLLILLGGSIAHGCEVAGKAFLDGIAKQLMIVGGEGHTTPFLRSVITEKYPNILTKNRMEADIIADFFHEKYALSKDDFWIEKESTNCGENALFALKLAKEKGICPRTVILMQDSSMQLRMDATFRKEWREWKTEFIGYASYRAHIIIENNQMIFADNPLWGMWSLERYITLLLGEIPRLHDTPSGYGPNGKNYILHIDIPNEVIQAFEDLKIYYGKYIREPWHGN